MNKVAVRTFLIFFVTLVSQIGHASEDAIIDSLKNELNNAKNDRIKVDIFVTLADHLLKEEYHTSKIYLQKAISISNSIDYNKGLADSYYTFGKLYNLNKKSKLAVENLEKAAHYYKIIQDNDKIASAYNNIGIVFKNNADYRKAIKNFNIAENIAEVIEDYDLLGTIYNNKGIVYAHVGSYEEAMKHYLESKKIKEQLKDKLGLAKLYGNISNLYILQEYYDKALQNQNLAKEIFDDIGSDLLVARTYNNIGSIYKFKKEYDSALYYYGHAAEFFKGSSYELGATISSNIARIYSVIGNYEQSITYSKEALDIFNNLNKKAEAAGVYIEIAEAYLELGDWDPAYENLSQGLEIAQAIDSKLRERDAYHALHKYYYKQNDYQKALQNYIIYDSIRNIMFNEEKDQKIKKLVADAELEKKEAENEVLKQKFIRKELENKALIAGGVFMLLFAVYFYNTTQQKKRTNRLLSTQNHQINQKQHQIIAINESLQTSQEQLHKLNDKLKNVNIELERKVLARTSDLQKSNQELDTFLYQSSHALRRPIVNILGLVQIARLEPNPLNIPKIYEKIDDTASKMDLMLKKLVMVSEVNLAELNLKDISFDQVINECFASLGPNLISKKIIFEKDIQQNIQFVSDKRLLDIIFQNLLENSLNFSLANDGRDPMIKISIHQNELDYITIHFHDNGMGIPKEAVSGVFEMFSVATNRTKGYGLGLYIVRKAIEKLKGRISVDSKENKYTTFKIVLPALEAHPLVSLV